MGSEDTPRTGRQRTVPVIYFAPVLALAAAVILWLVSTAPHMGADGARAAGNGAVQDRAVDDAVPRAHAGVDGILEASQLAVERYCDTELANLMVLQQELRGLAQQFDNMKDTLGPSVLAPAGRRHRQLLQAPPPETAAEDLATASADYMSCPAKLSAAVTTMSHWLGAMRAEVATLKRSSGTSGAAAKELQDAKDARDQAVRESQVLQQKLEAALKAAPAVAPAAPSSQCWIRDKNDGVLLNRTVVRGSPVYVNHVRQSMVLPENDEWVGRWIYTTESPFDTPILLRMLEYIKPGDVVLDIGANLGTYSIWFADRVGGAGSVWSFEPQPYVYQVLCANVVINGHRNIRTVNAALSFRAGTASMDSKVPDGTSQGKDFDSVTKNHTTKINYGGRRLGVGGEKVPMLQLDTLKLPKVSFMKIDVQGAEPLVLWGAKETIQRTLPVINYENSWGYKVTPEMKQSLNISDEVANFDMGAWLISIGYKYVEIISEDQFFIPPNWVPPPGWVAPATPPPTG